MGGSSYQSAQNPQIEHQRKVQQCLTNLTPLSNSQVEELQYRVSTLKAIEEHFVEIADEIRVEYQWKEWSLD